MTVGSPALVAQCSRCHCRWSDEGDDKPQHGKPNSRKFPPSKTGSETLIPTSDVIWLHRSCVVALAPKRREAVCRLDRQSGGAPLAAGSLSAKCEDSSQTVRNTRCRPNFTQAKISERRSHSHVPSETDRQTPCIKHSPPTPSNPYHHPSTSKQAALPSHDRICFDLIKPHFTHL